MTGTLAGFVPVALLMARRDRGRIVLWVAGVVALVLLTSWSVQAIYPTQADLDVVAAASRDNPAALAFNGPAQALDTPGGQVAFQIGAFGLTIVGLMNILVVGRWTRGEEDSGRLELVRSMPVGRHAPLAAAVAVAVAMDVLVGLGAAASLVGTGLPVKGSVVLGASYTAMGLVFLGATAVAAQVTENPRVASGLAGGLLGLSYVLRAVGDIGDGTVSWLSPIGWGQKARPFAGEQWAPLVLTLAVGVALVAGAGRLGSVRDFGGGLLPSRGGPPRAAASLGRPIGLALRLGRPAASWWAVAVLLIGVAYGSVADSIEQFVADNDAIADMIARAGGASLTDAYLATSLLVLALVAAAGAVQAAARPHAEEAARRAELVLATPLSRPRWVASHLVVALAGGLVGLGAAGVGVGVSYGVVAHDLDALPRLVLAAFLYAPAVAVLVALASLLYGLAPRWAAAAWAPVVACMVVGVFGPLLRLPAWASGLSPFERTPQLPADDVRLLPLLVMTLLAGLLLTAGIASLRRRDLG